jgi:hypothetical protein
MRMKHLFAGLLTAGLLAGEAQAQSPGIGGVPVPIPTEPAPTTPTTIPTTTIPTTTAVIEASSITTGCDIQNVGTVPLYVSRAGTATAASQSLATGQAYHCPGPSTTGLSVYNASGTTAGTLAGEVY